MRLRLTSHLIFLSSLHVLGEQNWTFWVDSEERRLPPPPESVPVRGRRERNPQLYRLNKGDCCRPALTIHTLWPLAPVTPLVAVTRGLVPSLRVQCWLTISWPLGRLQQVSRRLFCLFVTGSPSFAIPGYLSTNRGFTFVVQQHLLLATLSKYSGLLSLVQVDLRNFPLQITRQQPFCVPLRILDYSVLNEA